MAHVRPVQRKTGQAFEVRWKANGKDRQRTFTVRREAERFAARVTVEVSDGASTDQHRRNTRTVAEAWEIVAADDALRKKRSTLERYDQVWRNQVEPRWGSVRVRDVEKKAITEWAGVLLEGGLSSASSLKAVQVLSKAMGQAVDEGWATANPAQRVRLSKAPPPIDDHVVLTPEQIDRVAEELEACPPYDLLVRFAAWTGLRAGELTALRLRDVNPLSGEVAVVRTMYRDPKSEAGWRVDTPKTRANRSVAIYDDRVVADLRRYVAQHPNAADPEALLPHIPRWQAPTRSLRRQASAVSRPCA